MHVRLTKKEQQKFMQLLQLSDIGQARRSRRSDPFNLLSNLIGHAVDQVIQLLDKTIRAQVCSRINPDKGYFYHQQCKRFFRR